MTTCQQGTRRDVGVVGDEKGGGGREEGREEGVADYKASFASFSITTAPLTFTLQSL